MITVIMPTLPERRELFERQCTRIKELDPEVVILTCDDTEKTIGQKRGELLAKVETEYVMHLDDDDIIDGSMFSEISKAIESGPDAVAYKEAQYKHGVFQQIASLGCKDGTPKEMGIVHRNPVKTELAQKVGFYDLNLREDTIFGLELSYLLESVAVIDKVLYHYLDNKDAERDDVKFIECNGDPRDLCPQCKNLFNYRKYGKVLPFLQANQPSNQSD